MRRYYLFFLPTLLISSAFAGGEYCVAIRGNGQNAPAHWSALSRLVEENGLPKKMAGGSSASVTMFFVDSMAGNSIFELEKDPLRKQKMQALLLKSMPEFAATLAEHDKVASAWEFMSELKRNNSDLSKKVQLLFSNGKNLNRKDFESAFEKYSPLVNPELVRGLAVKPEFFQREARQSVSAIGNFDAVNDKNIFFRPGLIDFKSFSVMLGRMADFYAGNTDQDTKEQLEGYLRNCAEKSFGKQWREIPDCRENFKKIVHSYLDKGNFQDKAVFEPIGKNIDSVPSTSIVTGVSAKTFRDLRESYLSGIKNKDFYNFKVRFSDSRAEGDLSFGYFGSDDGLNKIDIGLSKYRTQGNLKSTKYAAIGNANWFEVLSTSPAEPGLSSLQKIPTNTSREQILAEMDKPFAVRWNALDYRKDILSAGGWSDLHPTEVLKAAGCEQVVYLTRVGGEAVFAQQIFIRLIDEKEKVPFWKNLKEKNNEGWNLSGTNAEGSFWARLYNNSPKSSFNKAIALADIVYCSDWNQYEPLHGEMWDMTEQAYGEDSPLLLKNGVSPYFNMHRPKKAATTANYSGCVVRSEGRGPALGSPNDIKVKPAN